MSRSSLEKLVTDQPQYKGRNKLTKHVRIRLVSAVRCAIRMRAKEKNKTKATLLLSKDIRNSIHHIFGNHGNCSDFCKAKSTVSLTPNIDQNIDITSNDDELSEVFEEQASYWSDGSALSAQEEARNGIPVFVIQIRDPMALTVS